MFYWQTNRRISARQDKEIFLTRHTRIDLHLVKLAVMSGMEKAGFSAKDTKVKSIEPPILRGLINNVLPVVLVSGREVIIRMHPQGVKNGYFWVEKVATDLAKQQGVPTYTTLVVDDSRGTVPFDFMLMSKESGRPMQDLWPLENRLDQKLITETGRLVALIHQVKPHGFGFFNNGIAKNKNKLVGQYREFRQHLYAALADDLRFLEDHAVIPSAKRQNIERVFQKYESLMEWQIPTLIHNDIADWNVLTDKKRITGIMDWDECFGGDPLMDLAAYSLFFGEPRLTWFKDGYKRIGKLENNEEKFQLFKLRYLISKLHLRKKRSLVDDSP